MVTKITEVVNLYRKLLYPMGYMVTPKPEIKGEGWAPAKIVVETYEKMSSGDIDGEINELRTEQNRLNAEITDIKTKAIEILNNIPPSDATKDFYEANYAGNQYRIIPNKVKIESKRITEISNLINYLTDLKKEKIRGELLKKFKESKPSIENIDFDGGVNIIIK